MIKNCIVIFRAFVCLLMVLTLSACGTTSSSEQGFYRVEKGDTLYRIAQKNNQSVANLRKWNNLSGNDIAVGQRLRVSPKAAAQTPSRGTKKSNSSSSAATPRARPPAQVPASASKITLVWPAKGSVLKSSASRNNGIDIGGQRGDPIVAAAAGKVVYVGEGIRGYGKLLVIKHNADYLTAYAHNDTLLVKEGEQVRQGQKVATMGDSDADRVMLHFELRYKGNAVNPVKFLP